ncbi:MAG: hypothetical protein L3J80_04080, partial [Thermoplasmata archaeon]|nr:hypothetical protein [Thermoplasmata archaeon]
TALPRVHPGVAPGLLAPVLTILRATPTPIRRRKLLEELERRGHRISLAGLNRILQQCRDDGLTQESPDGIRLAPRTP